MSSDHVHRMAIEMDSEIDFSVKGRHWAMAMVVVERESGGDCWCWREREEEWLCSSVVGESAGVVVVVVVVMSLEREMLAF